MYQISRRQVLPVDGGHTRFHCKPSFSAGPITHNEFLNISNFNLFFYGRCKTCVFFLDEPKTITNIAVFR